MTLWDKGSETDPAVLKFSAGKEYALDRRLVPFDCRASRAHARGLGEIGVLSADEVRVLTNGLTEIEALAGRGEFEIRPEQEDGHTAIEEWLTENVGEAGRKIHLGRSRNDQVLAAIRLFEMDGIDAVVESLRELRQALVAAAEAHRETAMPGYTHLRRAMPTTVGTWLGAFGDAIDDDLVLLDAARRLVDRSPLGTGAGFGIRPRRTARAGS